MNQNATSFTADVTGWRLRLLSFSQQHPKLNYLILFLLGACGTLSFAPFYFWPSYLVGIGYLFLSLMLAKDRKQAFACAVSFALGLFSAGVSWVYISVANFGQVGLVIAALITFGLILAASLYWGVFGYVFFRLNERLPIKFMPFLFIASLLGFEWLRSWLFTGFPWLLPGYIVEASWLFEWLPIGGIWFVSAVCLLSGVAVAQALICRQYRWASFAGLLWLAAGVLSMISPSFVSPTETQRVTLVQGNVAQDQKWLSETAQQTLSFYQQATLENLDSDIVIWPETAITYLQHQVKPFFERFGEQLADEETTLITGVPVYDPRREAYFNGVWALGNGFGLYEKQKLVPFGEYVPLAQWFGPIFDLFGMPMSQFKKGPANQPTLQAGEISVAPFICYEVVYPELVRSMVRDSDVLLTISNDAWFGDSIGPLQHLQIAQFRAKESGRYMIRATNNGVTAIINERGEIEQRLPQFTQAVLNAEVKGMQGNTPYVLYGNLGLWLLLAAMAMLASLPQQARHRVKTP
ncbi:apolipoprotein N-acyltransferase [Marinomonas ostreistagni]|uniref:apolipoprotein N-acyltransferase n=1 Tax=Marinomonas ostreistagni TaxID=359209 RepID=UPI00195009FA|nr:apolipoprotein N-acyltransferase [Marinomonas ostreistagni]MBM6549689.1 apolipoprotein N-acyltransferase [Marinomonas ostreistagni]